MSPSRNIFGPKPVSAEQGHVAVLMYHRVNGRLPEGEFVVSPADFESQMGFLSSRGGEFEVVGIEKALGFLDIDGGKETDAKPKAKVLITFDDGYEDNYRYAFPALKKYSLTAVVFLTTDYIGTGYKRPRYKNTPWEHDYLSEDEIIEMHEWGIGFGGHTATHPHLLKLSGEDARAEIERSFIRVNKITGEPRPPFSYPYGEYSDGIKSAVREAGFSCAFTTDDGVNRRGQDIFEIKRIAVSGMDTVPAFRRKLTAPAAVF